MNVCRVCELCLTTGDEKFEVVVVVCCKLVDLQDLVISQYAIIIIVEEAIPTYHN